MATDDDAWDPDTGVHDTAALSRRAQTARPAGGASARRAVELIDALSGKFEEHAQLDKLALDRINDRLDDHSETLSQLRETTAASNATLSFIRDEISHTRRLEIVKVESEAKVQVVRAEGEKQLSLETAKNTRFSTAWRSRIVLGLISLVSGGVALLAKYLLGG